MNERACFLIKKENKILLIHRFKGGREYYVVPGGTVESGESIENACIREAKEETNLDIQLGPRLWEQINNGRREHYFLVNRFTGNLRLGGPELAQQSLENRYILEWIDLNDLSKINLLPPENRLKIIEHFQT